MAIGKHVIAKDTLAGRGEGIGIDESADLGIVITGLEVIEPSFDIVELAMNAQMWYYQNPRKRWNQKIPSLILIRLENSGLCSNSSMYCWKRDIIYIMLA